ncbi:flagellar basal body P-ring formation chaperone FlgA [Geothrix sp.]|jgi:flagella basal body P-ring formation protein FlgA|uniref:flagellar basal body P-ring formation chaperone FlgA n=1 Tax=Geothrix sp. TaxID=1962974 RepID=UPI0025BD608E|nr:flagellar basal body P-ring formation chaperone FlgA [Geothrix sp.]
MRTAALLLLAPALVAQAPVSPAERLADAAVAFAQAEAAKLGGAHTFKIAQPPRVPVVRAGALTFEPSHLSKREPLGRFFVVVALKVDGEKVGMARVDLDGSWVGTVLRAKGDLARKTELSADQVESSPFEGVPPEGALTAIPEGQRLMRSVISGKILTRADLEPVPLVQSGDKVRLTATHDSLSITLDTTARSRGGLGDRVRLEAPGARRQVTAVITGPGEAKLP